MSEKAIFTHLKFGILLKKGMGTVYRPWSRRYFALGVDFTLKYYDEDNKLKGTLKLRGASVKPIPKESADGRDFAFEIFNLDPSNDKGSSLIVAAESQKDMVDWISHIKMCIAEIEQNTVFRPSEALWRDLITGGNDAYLGTILFQFLNIVRLADI
jgi:hypothetical protein